MHLNLGFLKFQFGNQFGEENEITQTQPRFVLKLSINLKLGMICT